MKFLNLNTGYSFDALWTEEQQKGYIFWFPNEQSTGITNTMQICALTESDSPLELTMENNDIFSFISNDNSEINIDGYTFKEPIYSKTFRTIPQNIGKYFAHVFNISCQSNLAGEYICKINIKNIGYIRVGADLYDLYEPTQINLSNFGIEISDGVQKAIYDSNVHEDLTDNILVNRKFKELLSNYWDIIANKGSYKSLLNSLSWFEWGDILKIREIWKHIEADRTIFDDREFMSIFENKIDDTFSNIIKTSYISLYCSLQNELDEYDDEFNPKLADAILKWSKNDIQLKLSLLAKFFGMHFLPIHLSLLHVTAEDKVFTNTIKNNIGTLQKREDFIGDFTYIECNIKDDSLYRMSNVRTQVTDKTVFPKLGVDLFPKNDIDENNITLFAEKYYTGPGVIIPIELIINNQTNKDFITTTFVNEIININGNIKQNNFEFKHIFKVKNNTININFNYLAKHNGKYELYFTFILASGKTLTRKVIFNVIDNDNLNINVYKIVSKDDTKGFSMSDFLDTKNSKYLFRIQSGLSDLYYQQYLPYMSPDNKLYKSYNGIKLNRTIILNVSEMNKNMLDLLRSIMCVDFLEFIRYDLETGLLKYLVYVSKKFFEDTPYQLFDNIYNYNYKTYIVRNDLGFYPQFHEPQLLLGDKIENYTLTQYDALCCAMEINTGKTITEFKYGYLIDSAEWCFYNHLTNEKIELPMSSRKPFIAKTNELLNQGYYDITFKYSLTDGIVKECNLNSAFRIKHIK